MTSFLCKNPRVILILGTGYLGKALAESLRKAGHTAAQNSDRMELDFEIRQPGFIRAEIDRKSVV